VIIVERTQHQNMRHAVYLEPQFTRKLGILARAASNFTLRMPQLSILYVRGLQQGYGCARQKNGSCKGAGFSAQMRADEVNEAHRKGDSARKVLVDDVVHTDGAEFLGNR